MGKQRKSRNNLSTKSDVDIMKPIPLELIGTVDDPCFGKLNDPNAEECNRCGDCELCAIIQSQNLHVKRKAVEEKQPFKDMQTLKVTWKTLLIEIKKRLRKGSLTLPQLKHRVCKRLGIQEASFDKHYKILVTKSIFKKRILLTGNTLKLKK